MAKVNRSGKVTGIKQGTAVITASVKYKKKATLKSTCKITVKKARANNNNNNAFSGVSINIKYPTMMYREGAMVFYTLKTGGYSGKLALKFKTSNYMATKTITVAKNSTYELSTLVSLSGSGGSYLPGGIYMPPTQRTVPITVYASNKVIGTISPSLSGTVHGISIPNDFCKKVG